jgi:hypothetical protein
MGKFVYYELLNFKMSITLIFLVTTVGPKMAELFKEYWIKFGLDQVPNGVWLTTFGSGIGLFVLWTFGNWAIQRKR